MVCAAEEGDFLFFFSRLKIIGAFNFHRSTLNSETVAIYTASHTILFSVVRCLFRILNMDELNLSPRQKEIRAAKQMRMEEEDVEVAGEVGGRTGVSVSI